MWWFVMGEETGFAVRDVGGEVMVMVMVLVRVMEVLSVKRYANLGEV